MSCLGRSRGYSLKQEVPSRTELAAVKFISVVLVEQLLKWVQLLLAPSRKAVILERCVTQDAGVAPLGAVRCRLLGEEDEEGAYEGAFS